jgi:hypothetical protein
MNPRDFFDTFWRPVIRNEVFVAMPFKDSVLEPVWTQAIEPAIETDCGMPAQRLDVTTLTGSVITSILDHVAHSFPHRLGFPRRVLVCGSAQFEKLTDRREARKRRVGTKLGVDRLEPRIGIHADVRHTDRAERHPATTTQPPS